MNYQAPLDDMQFVLQRWLDAPADWAHMPAFADIDGALAAQVLEEAARFAGDILAPLNGPGDRQGCRLDAGRVRTPDGFAQAYRHYCDGGWPGLALSPEHGGQGLPHLLEAAFCEMLFACNHGWAMYTGIVQGACQCLIAHGTPEQQARWLPLLVSGQWLPTMCLTEPGAGSDVGQLRCRAEPDGQRSYRISGSKLFISGGDQDWTPGILHLVLARLPDAPPGSRGISLFAVPVCGADDGVSVDGLEHKLGIRASATCALHFDGAQAELIGAPHQGLRAMFVMMNSARLHVGLQGLGHLDAARQMAQTYADERQQFGRAIAEHPAVRHNLLELRARSEALRALGYWTAHWLDLAAHHPDSTERARAERLASLLTPIVKAGFTAQGFAGASAALQVFGGYGYVQDYGIEQTLRDSRVAMLYEGTNEIQANDLVLRKVLGDEGRALGELLAIIDDEIAQAEPELAAPLVRLVEGLRECVAGLSADPASGAGIAVDFLSLMFEVLQGYVWLRAIRVAPEDQGKYETGAFHLRQLLPRADGLLAVLLGPLCGPFATTGRSHP